MKRLFLVLMLVALLAVPCFAGEDDIVSVEVIEDVARYEIDTIKMLRYTETAIITWRKVDANGDAVGEEFDVTFMNREDDPETVEDETSTDFTDFYNYLHVRIIAGDSLKTAITKACKIKLGL